MAEKSAQGRFYQAHAPSSEAGSESETIAITMPRLDNQQSHQVPALGTVHRAGERSCPRSSPYRAPMDSSNIRGFASCRAR